DPLVVAAALDAARFRCHAEAGMGVGQVHHQGRRFGQRLAVHQQGRDDAARVEGQVFRPLLVLGVEVEPPEFVLGAEFDQQPVHHHARRSGRVVEGVHLASCLGGGEGYDATRGAGKAPAGPFPPAGHRFPAGRQKKSPGRRRPGPPVPVLTDRNDYIGWTSSACMPFWPCTTLNETFWPSCRLRKPEPTMERKWTNTSSPFSRLMKPKPLASLNHLTVPI